MYTVDDLIRLYDVHRNTVSNWVAEGLRPSDASLPYVFNGTEVKRFHDAKDLLSNATLRLGEFKCFKCKQRVFPEPSSVNRVSSQARCPAISASCPVCRCVIYKRVNETDCDKILNCCDTNTTLASLDEEYNLAPVAIVNDATTNAELRYCSNDRVLYEWLKFAGRWDDKTISAKLASIRRFEVFCQGKPFEKITTADANSFRDCLKSSVAACADDRRSISTVRHCASHLKSFFKWLIDQKGYHGLTRVRTH